MNPCKNCGARYVECGECGDDITSGIDHLIEDNKTSRAKVATLEAEGELLGRALSFAEAARDKHWEDFQQANVDRARLRGLCGEAAPYTLGTRENGALYKRSLTHELEAAQKGIIPQPLSGSSGEGGE